MNSVFEKIPSKDVNKFKIVIQSYDKKNYKKANKNLNQLLKKSPNQSEYLVMQALIQFLMTNSETEKKEHLKQAKSALLKNLKSSFNWQICGLIYRFSKNFKEAAKCYKQALKFSPDNEQVFRDVNNLFLQSREFIEHKNTRKEFLNLKPSSLSNWAGYALANHLTLDYEQALKVLNTLLDIIQKQTSPNLQQLSNILLYKAMILLESENFQELKQFLIKEEPHIKNKIYYHEYLYKACRGLNENQNALKCVDYLLKLMPRNEVYQQWFFENQEGEFQEKLDNFCSQYKTPGNNILIMKNMLVNEQFNQKFQQFFQKNCCSFSPSFFVKMQSIANSREKWKAMQNLVEKEKESIENKKEFCDGQKIPDPTCKVFVNLTLAQIYFVLKKYDQAIQLLDQEYKETPTYPELIYWKCKCLKKLGKTKEASEQAQIFQQYDRADRCLTKQSLKFMLKNNNNQKVNDNFKSFMQGAEKNESNLHELQQFSYEIGLGTSYFNELKFARALKMFSLAVKNFDELFEDQYDFYSYCLRRFYLFNLVDVLRFNDNSIRNGVLYQKAHYKYLKTLYLLKKYYDYKKYCEEQKIENCFEVFDEENIVTTENEADLLELDLDGQQLIKQIDIDQELEEKSTNLFYLQQQNSQNKRMLKAYDVIYRIQIDSEKIQPLILIKLLKYLLKHDLKNKQNEIRKVQFKNCIEKMEKDEKTQQLVDEYTKQFEDQLQQWRFKQTEKVKNGNISRNA